MHCTYGYRAIIVASLQELEEVRRRYEAQYGSELAADIGSGEPLSDLLAHLARGERERGSAVYQAKAEADAQQLSEVTTAMSGV